MLPLLQSRSSRARQLGIVILRSWVCALVVWLLLVAIPLVAEQLIPGCKISAKSPAIGCGAFDQLINLTALPGFFLGIVVFFTAIPVLVLTIILGFWNSQAR